MSADPACPDEDSLLAFVEGRQSGVERNRTEAHLGGCASCREVVAAVAPAVASATALGPITGPRPLPGAELGRGTNIGRYVVLSLVGRGGMGEVYAAYDPELDRKIALKLLHGGGGAAEPDGHARLLREAKAIAKLSHPNVVTVHDAGTIDGRVFIAMEFVDGETMSAWVAEAPRPWRQVRDLFLDAGRALAAAHAVGLVHRDFKPQNVMVGEDGKVRVMDFGLAARVESGEPSSGASAIAAELDEAGVSPTMTAALTRTGTLVGTPAYMSPEQFLAQPTDARTDQFSFCVSLYEALYGERPFAGKTAMELAANVIGGTIREPRKGRVPPWVRRVLVRGLSPKREQRWPTMEALLDVLARDPERQRRRVGVAAAAAVALLVGGAFAQRAATKAPSTLCKGAPARLAGAWEVAASGAHHEATRASFLATGLSYAEDTWRRTTKGLDDYARKWTDMYTSTCEATQLRGEQSVEVMDLKMDCLGQALDGLGSLTKLLERASASVVVEAVNATLSLPELDRCSNVALLRAVTPPPRDPKLRAVIDELRRRGAELKALHDTGQTTEALRRVHGLETDARAAGYPPVEAELLSRIALLYIDMGDAKYKAATEGSFWAALESRQDELAANDATLLSAVTGRDPAQGAEARRWDRLAAALLARMGPGHDVTRAWLLQARGNVATAEGKFDTAQREYAEAAALKEKALGPDHPDVARSLDAAAVSLVGMGQAAASIPLHERSIAIMERSFGRDSPQVSYLFGNLGEAYLALHREDEAIRAFERAIALRKNVGDPMSDFLAYPLVGLGRALVVVGRAAEAVAPLERALLIREKNDPAAERLGEVRFALGRALAARGRGGDAERARALVARARADYAETPPSDARTAALAELDRWRPPAR